MDGTQALQQEFKSLLTRHGRVVPPMKIVYLLSTDEGMSGHEFYLSILDT